MTAPLKRAPLHPVIQATLRCLAIGCLLTLWFAAYTLVVSGIQAGREQAVLYRQFRQALAEQTAPIGGDIPTGTPVAWIESPGIGLRQIVVEGTSGAELTSGPGHRRDTPLPGQAGTSVVYGRSLGYGGAFSRLTELGRGATITVTTQQGRFDYTVDGTRHIGDPLPDVLASGKSRLTLVTAEGTGWRTGWAPDQIVYLDATLKGPPQPAISGRPTHLDVAELAMQSDLDAFTPLLIWLPGLMLALSLSIWAGHRWGFAQTWLAMVPVVLTGLWGSADSLLRLLPNLY